MSTVSAGLAATPVGGEDVAVPQRSRVWALPLAALRLIVGSLLIATPFTAVLVLGWLMRVMRRETVIATLRYSGAGNRKAAKARMSAIPELREHVYWPGWFGLGRSETKDVLRGRLAFLIGGLKRNIALGLATLLTVGAMTAPYGLLWLLSWWGGWENSFNKGYEQAFVGPLVGLSGVALALITLSYLPMALAHQAAEARAGAVLEIRHVRRLIAAAGWRYVALGLLWMIAALPIFAATGAPVFIEKIRPGFAALQEAEINAFFRAYHFWIGVYVLVALIALRCLLARVYAYAATHTGGDSVDIKSPHSPFVPGIADAAGLTLPTAVQRGRWRARLDGLMRGLALATIWFGLVAQIYVGQFLNHRWWSWVNHPLIGLPWFPGPG